MEKISVKVCLGTTCFVMGGSNLQELNDIILSLPKSRPYQHLHDEGTYFALL